MSYLKRLLLLGVVVVICMGCALSLMIAGGTSNLIDRYVNDGYVIDFINVGIGPLRTGIFNVADVALMAGLGLWIAQCWRRTPRIVKVQRLQASDDAHIGRKP